MYTVYFLLIVLVILIINYLYFGKHYRVTTSDRTDLTILKAWACLKLSLLVSIVLILGIIPLGLMQLEYGFGATQPLGIILFNNTHFGVLIGEVLATVISSIILSRSYLL